MCLGTLVSNKDLGRGLVVENEGSGWLVCWYEHGRGGKFMKTIVKPALTHSDGLAAEALEPLLFYH